MKSLRHYLSIVEVVTLPETSSAKRTALLQMLERSGGLNALVEWAQENGSYDEECFVDEECRW